MGIKCNLLCLCSCCTLLLLSSSSSLLPLLSPLPSCPPPSILIAPAPVCLAVLDVNNGNNNRIPSLIVLSRKLSPLVHLSISRPNPSTDAKCDDHCHSLDSRLAAAMTMMMTTTIIEDGETTIVHSPGGGVILWVRSPSLFCCCCCCQPTTTSQC
jgi:hypothetical protein